MKTDTNAATKAQARIAELRREDAEYELAEQRIREEVAESAEVRNRRRVQAVKAGEKADGTQSDYAGLLQRLAAQRRTVQGAIASLEADVAIEHLKGERGYRAVAPKFNAALRSLEALAVAVDGLAKAQREAMAAVSEFEAASGQLAGMAAVPGAPAPPWATWRLVEVNTFQNLLSDGWNPGRIDVFMAALVSAGIPVPIGYERPWQPQPVRQGITGPIRGSAEIAAAHPTDVTFQTVPNLEPRDVAALVSRQEAE